GMLFCYDVAMYQSKDGKPLNRLMASRGRSFKQTSLALVHEFQTEGNTDFIEQGISASVLYKRNIENQNDCFLKCLVIISRTHISVSSISHESSQSALAVCLCPFLCCPVYYRVFTVPPCSLFMPISGSPASKKGCCGVLDRPCHPQYLA
ncbi:hypothetical protein STEG23_026679, partial [Scotinomys teguina]